MEFYEKIGPASYSLLNRFLDKGDLYKYDFTDLFYSIENAQDLIEFFSLAEESKSLAKNKDIISKKLLHPLAEQKSPVILSELFSLKPKYLKSFPDFKELISKENVEIAFYESIQQKCKQKKPGEVQKLIQDVLKEILTDPALYTDSEQAQKKIGTLVYSANSDIRLGVEEFLSYLTEEINVFDINEKPQKTPISNVLADYLLRAFRHGERSENEKQIGFVENSLNLMEETTFSAKLKVLFKQNREDPLLIGLLMDLIFAINTPNPKPAVRQIMQQIYDSLKDDKREFNKMVEDWKQGMQKEEKEEAEQILAEEVK